MGALSEWVRRNARAAEGKGSLTRGLREVAGSYSVHSNEYWNERYVG